MGFWKALFGRRRKQICAGSSRIAGFQILIEPPLYLDGLDPGQMQYSFPHDLFVSADRELGLSGELISLVEQAQVLPVRGIKRLENSERQSFFAKQANSPLWGVFYGSGASGARYNVLVDYRTQPGVRFDTEASRKGVYLEYDGLYTKAIIEHLVENPEATTESVADRAMSSASHEIMCRYGLSTEEMMAIIEEGLTKLWS